MLKAFDVVQYKEETGWHDKPFGRKGQWYSTQIWYKTIDTVFFDSSMSENEIKRSLIDHDGYPNDIFVRKAK